MVSAECNGGFQPAGWKGRDGRLWFPTIHGAVVVDPATLRVSAEAPPVVLERLVADGRDVGTSPGQKLPAGTRSVEIQYTGLSFFAASGFVSNIGGRSIAIGWTRDRGSRITTSAGRTASASSRSAAKGRTASGHPSVAVAPRFGSEGFRRFRRPCSWHRCGPLSTPDAGLRAREELEAGVARRVQRRVPLRPFPSVRRARIPGRSGYGARSKLTATLGAEFSLPWPAAGRRSTPIRDPTPRESVPGSGDPVMLLLFLSAFRARGPRPSRRSARRRDRSLRRKCPTRLRTAR